MPLSDNVIYQGKIVRFSEALSLVSLEPASIICDMCGNHCQKLMVVDGETVGLSNKQYHLIRCLNCIFWGPYYVYFEEDEPSKVHFKQGENHHFMQEMISDFAVRASVQWINIPAKTLTMWDTFIGNKPIWIQHPEWPACPKCKIKMDFILQLSTSTLDEGHRQLGNNFYIQLEYGATLYFFFCHQCDISCSITQNS